MIQSALTCNKSERPRTYRNPCNPRHVLDKLPEWVEVASEEDASKKHHATVS
jgi:hypothetical protein